jgi:DNA repair exonuclease SbcCD ATPase subunit
MGLPQQVRNAEDRSNTLIAQIEEGRKEDQAAPQPAPKPAEEPAAPPPAPPEADAAEWRARYNTLRGKYDAEVPRLAKELREIKERNKALDEQIASLRTELQTAQAKAPATPALDDLNLDPDLVAYIEQRAQAIAAQQMEPMRQMVDESKADREARLAREQDEERKTRFLNELTEFVPDWQAFDKEPGFDAFLKQQDEATGSSRQDVLTSAARSYDVLGVARVFNRYRTVRAATPAAQQVIPDLSQQVVPSASGTAQVVAGDKKVLRASEVRKFYTDVSRGAIRDPERIKSMQAEIETAQREGRIAPG